MRDSPQTPGGAKRGGRQRDQQDLNHVSPSQPSPLRCPTSASPLLTPIATGCSCLASRSRRARLSRRRICPGAPIDGIQTMPSLIARVSSISSASSSSQTRVRLLGLSRVELPRGLQRVVVDPVLLLIRLHGALCGSGYPSRVARRPPGHPPHIRLGPCVRQHRQARSVRRRRRWQRSGVPHLPERACCAPHGQFASGSSTLPRTELTCRFPPADEMRPRVLLPVHPALPCAGRYRQQDSPMSHLSRVSFERSSAKWGNPS